jgi:hypothetical protein
MIQLFLTSFVLLTATLADVSTAAPAKSMTFSDAYLGQFDGLSVGGYLEACSLSGDCSPAMQQLLADFFCNAKGFDYAASFASTPAFGRDFCDRKTCYHADPGFHSCDPKIIPGRLGNPDELSCPLQARVLPAGTLKLSQLKCRNKI